MTTPTDDLASDATLLTRWRTGDERAATEIVERHAPALARFAASLGARSEIEELVQDTFVRAFGSLDGFRGESTLRTWLFTIMRRLVLDQRRARARRPISVPVEEDDINRETHEEHVHRRLRGEQHSAAWLEAVTSEQPTHARERPVGNLAALANDRADGGEDTA